MQYFLVTKSFWQTAKNESGSFFHFSGLTAQMQPSLPPFVWYLIHMIFLLAIASFIAGTNRNWTALPFMWEVTQQPKADLRQQVLHNELEQCALNKHWHVQSMGDCTSLTGVSPAMWLGSSVSSVTTISTSVVIAVQESIKVLTVQWRDFQTSLFHSLSSSELKLNK